MYTVRERLKMKCVVLIGGKPSKIEQEINDWLEKHPNAKVQFITQAGPSSSAVVTTIFYED